MSLVLLPLARGARFADRFARSAITRSAIRKCTAWSCKFRSQVCKKSAEGTEWTNIMACNGFARFASNCFTWCACNRFARFATRRTLGCCKFRFHACKKSAERTERTIAVVAASKVAWIASGFARFASNHFSRCASDWFAWGASNRLTRITTIPYNGKASKNASIGSRWCRKDNDCGQRGQ